MEGLLLETLVYGCLGIVIMLLGYFIVDLMIPVNFAEEIKKNNKAIGWVSAGIYIGLGFIVKGAIQSIVVEVEHIKLADGVMNTLVYSSFGLVFFLIGYFIVDLVNRKYKFKEELKAKNEAVGIMIFGIFIGIALVISGVIQ